MREIFHNKTIAAKNRDLAAQRPELSVSGRRFAKERECIKYRGWLQVIKLPGHTRWPRGSSRPRTTKCIGAGLLVKELTGFCSLVRYKDQIGS